MLPWLLEKAEDHVQEKRQMAVYTNDMTLASHVNEAAQLHADKVQEHKNRLEKAKLEAEEAERQRIANKLRRKQEKEAAKKAEEIRLLKE